MTRALIALIAGSLFGAGLALSGMADPARVQGFLDLLGAWDPTLAFVMGGAISLATLTLEAQYHERWLAYPGVLATAQVPLLTVIVTWLFYRNLGRKKDAQPFFWALALFGLCLVGLGISIWPDVIPARVSIWEAAAPPRSQVFMLIGASIMVPIILAYTAWSYWVFRGKVGSEGYH